YNITIIANDSGNNLNATQTSNFTVQNRVNPSVLDFLPPGNSSYTTCDVVTIAANVTDDYNISRVFANVSQPGGTIANTELVFRSANRYDATYALGAAGNYNVTFIANDSSNNINTTVTTNFTATTCTVESPGSSTSAGGSAPAKSALPPTVNPAPTPAPRPPAPKVVGEASPDEIRQFLLVNLKESFVNEHPSADYNGKMSIIVPITFFNTGPKLIRVKPTLAEKFTRLDNDAVIAAIQREQPLLSPEDVQKKAQHVQRIEEQQVQFLVGKVSSILGLAHFPGESSITGAIASSNNKYSCGLTLSRAQVEGKLLEPELLNGEEIVIPPGQVIEKNFEVLIGPSILPVIPLALISQSEVVAEREINIQGKVKLNGFAVTDKEAHALELYYFLPPGTAMEQYVFEVSIKSSPTLASIPIVPSKFSLPFTFTQPWISRTLCADTFGPYTALLPGTIFAQQFTYDPLLYDGNYIITTIISSGSTVIAEKDYVVQL
ncbi:MAG: hypothetical protein Q8R37_00770, partial [Nanoarchaeota archaeon]|nr:hypothetical protein [Nanoarchaeota archaeon]